MNTKTIAYVAAYLVVGYGLFYYFRRFHVSSEEKDLLTVSTKDLRSAFGRDFLKPWAEAIRKKQTSFQYNGRNFSTSTGKAIV